MKKIEEDDNMLGDELAEGLITLLDTPEKVSQTRKFMDMLVGYRELLMMYTCALKEVQTKFEVLDTEFRVRYQRNPISSFSTRLKHTNSIMAKLDRYGYRFSLENVEKYIHDAAGIRVICSYIDDIYEIADALLRQDDISLITRKDYIINPKPNGYRSLHLIVEVPVFFADYKKYMKVEVQIRTIAMDFWASLEHQLKYKQNIPNQQAIVEQLKECADVIALTDQKMIGIRQQIEAVSDAPTEEDILLEKLSRMDMNIG
uniref:RelA/SpoT domain-containing protein n=1 Tax=Eubacterium plexicaudatum ASF492 TaxID=1235802 RepID=N2BDS7_9FIRM